MILLIGYDETKVIHREDGRLIVELPDSDEVPGCYLVTAEGSGKELTGYTPKSRRTIYVGVKGGILMQPRKKPEEAATGRCPFTLPIPFPELVEEAQ